MLGYEICQGDVLEEEFKKIAIYTNSNKVPTHVARQLPTGKNALLKTQLYVMCRRRYAIAKRAES
ncbi:MAG: hypothetical protein V7K49_05820 [Nostoc sp.]